MVATLPLVLRDLAARRNRTALRARADRYFDRCTEGAALGEAAAICAYIADRYPETKLAPALTDPLRAKYLQWLLFSPSCIEPAIMQLYTKFEVPASTAAWGSAAQTFDALDAALQKGPWILGETFSAADIMLGSGLNFGVRLFKLVPPRPSFNAYIDRCVARPAFQRAEKIAAG